MHTIEWANYLSVGDDRIDADHKQLITLTNRLILPANRARLDLVLKVLDEVISYTRDHFDREEKYMEAAGYPDLAGHRERHRLLTEKVMGHRQVIVDHPRLWHGETVFVFLADWLLTHIANDDRRFGDFMRKSSVPAHTPTRSPVHA